MGVPATPQRLTTGTVHRVATLPFDHTRRATSALFDDAGRRLLVVKGAPEQVMANCTLRSGARGTAHAGRAVRRWPPRGGGGQQAGAGPDRHHRRRRVAGSRWTASWCSPTSRRPRRAIPWRSWRRWVSRSRWPPETIRASPKRCVPTWVCRPRARSPAPRWRHSTMPGSTTRRKTTPSSPGSRRSRKRD